ncbi:coat protein [ssRNA phage SRR5466728_5]|uniref:Coat protein n=1 Tax=ssRNA phage SRR5466728_5 TaxID=2786443 RepID=A0A8S5L172_9VIRU|nr:coat protein [ssRNA phage SRR5466728_5]DAD50858.1 TPA_asm: coat protein [ssRNA phage SRR5466728_5]
MLADPLVITVGGNAKSLNRINQDGYSSEYLLRDSTTEHRLKVRHSQTKADPAGQVYDRHNVEFTVVTFASGATPANYEKFYVVIECLPSATSASIPAALMALLQASSNAMTLALKQWQN